MSRDNDILVCLCLGRSAPAPLARLNVDDFGDPNEREISESEIHLTILGWDGREETPLACLTLSTVSAGTLIHELAEAIRRREPEGGWQ